MVRYVLKRLLWLIPVLLGVAIVIFSLLYITPGDPAQALLGENPTAEQIAAKHAELGLDDPYLVQMGRFLKQIFIDFDLGTSYIYKNSVTDEFLVRLPRTMIIAGVCCLMCTVVAIPLGVTAAVHQNKWQDQFCILLSMVTTAIPGFWFAMIMMLVFSLQLGLLPSFGIGGWEFYIMPCIAAGVSSIGTIARQTRSQMLESLHSDYVVTARSKGVSEQAIRYRHALPNAIIPVITSLGNHFGMALGGTVAIEMVFTFPGVGLYILDAINSRDYPVVRGCVVMLALIFSVVMVIVDLIYAFVDPRIKAQYEGQHKRRMKKNGK